jgi:hypothetical protein
MKNKFNKAAKLAHWLWINKNKKKNVAAIIACNKYKLNTFSDKPKILRAMTSIKKYGSVNPPTLFEI